jgi:hypothetical protein
MIPGFNFCKIETLDRGEALRKLNYELEQAIINCQDVNTTRKKRTVILKITIEPDEQRKELMVEYETKSTLQGEAPGADQIMLSPKGAYVSAKEQLTFDQQIVNIDGEEVIND